MTRVIRKHRRGLAVAIHALIAILAVAASFLLRFEFTLEPAYRRMLLESLPLLLAAKLAVFRAFGLRDVTWRYAGFEDLVRIVAANLLGSAASAILLRAFIGSALPRSIYVIDFLTATALLLGAHAAAKMWFDSRDSAPPSPLRRAAIYGAGQAGVILLREIQANPKIGFEVAGFFDDDPSKAQMRIHGARVLGGLAELPSAVRKRRIETVLVALPSATGRQLTAILEACHAAGVAAKRVPALTERMESRTLARQIRDVRLEDLLGRPPVDLALTGVRPGLEGRVVLVTGAGGSIGSELCRQIARFSPAALIGLDHSESALYEIDRQIGPCFVPELASIRDTRRLEEVFRRHRPDSVYHAAAYKHVPLMESHLFEAVENNVLGTLNVVRAASASGAAEFVLISSDKAVRPASVMGATKRLAELTAQTFAGSTRSVSVRFGNVLGSNGSVIPLFQSQIAAGGPITVTHPDMRRFFMTIPEAAQLVLQAAAIGEGGEIFVLEMGEPVRIVDLARKMILLSGLSPEDIPIEFCGIRPGEKLSEELSAYEENTIPTPHAQIRVLKSSSRLLLSELEDLRAAALDRDTGAVVLYLKELVPEFNPSGFLLRKSFQSLTAAAP